MSKTVETFRKELAKHCREFQEAISTQDGNWVVKGFIDNYQNIYTISKDTKVISKIIELMLFPTLSEFCRKYTYKMFLCKHQNHYPDICFIAEDGTKIALDLKSTYRMNASAVNGFTLGAFTGYFRQRSSKKNSLFPYAEFSAHFVLGILYTRTKQMIDEKKVYKLQELQSIVSVVKNVTFFLQEKWKIASDKPGSGNTKNIGSAKNIDTLVSGQGTFAKYGEEVFDDYWMNYLTLDMARKIESDMPYHNLGEYLKWKKKRMYKHKNIVPGHRRIRRIPGARRNRIPPSFSD